MAAVIVGIELRNATLLNLPAATIEREVEARLARCGRGPDGITETPILSNGHGELIYRNSVGDPIAVLGFCLDRIEDYCVAKRARRFGIATLLADRARLRHGARIITGPFTSDGFAFAQAWTDAQMVTH